MFIKIDDKVFNTDNITEIYAYGGRDKTTVYFNMAEDGNQISVVLDYAEYERLMHALETKGLLFVA